MPAAAARRAGDRDCGTAFERLRRMARAALAEVARTIERGSVTFLYRPSVEEQHPHGLADVQRLIVLLSPSGSLFQRAIAVGRKRLPRSARRDRFWGFVDLVLTSHDMQAALGAKVYGTKTLGLRHLPAACSFARGTYEISTHDDHAHLRWTVDTIAAEDAVATELDLEHDADYIITVANPDPAAWGLIEPPDLQSDLFDELESHVTLPSTFPPELQRRFRDRRFAQLDSIDWLNHPGAELVFVGAADA